MAQADHQIHLYDTIQHSLEFTLKHLTTETRKIIPVAYRNKEHKASVLLQRRTLRNQIKVLEQLGKVLEQLNTSMDVISEKWVAILTLLAPDSVVNKLVEEVQQLKVFLQKFDQYDRQSEMLVSGISNNMWLNRNYDQNKS